MKNVVFSNYRVSLLYKDVQLTGFIGFQTHFYIIHCSVQYKNTCMIPQNLQHILITIFPIYIKNTFTLRDEFNQLTSLHSFLDIK